MARLCATVRAFSTLLSAAALVAFPAAASAATVSATNESKGQFPALIYAAAQGEANSVTIGRAPPESGGAAVRVVDDGAPLSAGANCRLVGDHEAICRAFDAHVQLGDGNDRLDTAVPSFADGGPGDDVLDGSPAGDTFNGGDGRDTIRGAEGSDRIAGDAATPFPDDLDGAAGSDTIVYTDHTVPVTVNLKDPAAPAGADGEGDRIAGFESASGGRAASLLIGDDGFNLLDGGGPGTWIAAGEGNDLVFARDGVQADAGLGDDTVSSAPGSRVACGEGSDTLRSGGPGLGSDFGVVGADCERLPLSFVDVEDSVIRPHPSVGDRRATFRIPCPEDINLDDGCTGRVLMRDTRGRTLGKRRFRTGQGRIPAVGVALSDKTMRRIAREHGLEVVVSIIVSVGSADRADGRYGIVLLQPVRG